MSDTLLLYAQQASQEGRFADAARLYHEFLNATPAHPPALYALGMIYFQSSQFAQAEYLFGEAIKADPYFADGLCMRGVTLVKLSRPEDALACFEQAIRVRPDFIEALSNHATALLELGRIHEGLTGLDRVVALDPQHVLSWNNRGNALFALGRYTEAIESYDRALAIYPDFPDARQNRLLALGEVNRGGPQFPDVLLQQGEDLMRREQFIDALGRIEEARTVRPDSPEAASLHAIAMRNANTKLFDEYAPTFEESLLNNLNYRGHVQLHEMAERVWPGEKISLQILDLGCGTGLVGNEFKDWAHGGRLDGIDLSARMIEKATERGIYSHLVVGDVEPVLVESSESYDLVLASDTLIYFGELSSLFVSIANRLNSGGMFIFNVESKDNEGWEQTPKRRFRHSESYLRECAARVGLTLADRAESTLRFETGTAVPGFTMAFRK